VLPCRAILWKVKLIRENKALVAAQAHSSKQDRAVVISARNFIRAMGASIGLAVASSVFSNTLSRHLPDDIPASLADHIRDTVFEVPDVAGLSQDQQMGVFEAYATAMRSVFYLWIGAMACCLLLMLFIKDKGLQRKEEKPEVGQETDGGESGGDSLTSELELRKGGPPADEKIQAKSRDEER
jgi:hypothetical protein